tara:strand:- start:1032 stop:3152 length:2121 start_codon:yes stop_codon:yes gene_type:complete
VKFAFSRLATAVALTHIGLAFPVYAQQSVTKSDSGALQTSSTISSVQEEMVVTARRNDQSMQELIGEISRLDAELLAQIGHTHIQESVVRIPGVWMSRGNGQELLASVRSPIYTGAGSCGEALIAENSIPIRPSGFCNVNQLFEVNTEQAGALEVWRGAGTVFYGSNAVHGVVNTLTPNMDSNSIAVEAGPHDYYRSKLALGTQQGDHQWHIAVNGVSNGGLKDDAGYDQQKLTLQHAWQGSALGIDELDVHSVLSFVNLNQETAGFIRGEKAYEDNNWKVNPNPEAYRDANALRFSSTFKWHNSAGGQWQVSPYLRSSDMEFLMHFLPGQPIEKNAQDSVGFLSSYETAVSDSLRLWVGLEGEWANMEVEETQPNELSPTSERYQGDHYDFEVTSLQFAGFINAEWQLHERMALEAGVRWETIEYDYDNKLLVGSTRDDGSLCDGDPCRYFRAADREDRFTNASGHLGARFDLSANWNSYIRVASAYRAPQVNERYRIQKDQSVDQFDDKQAVSVELGARYTGESLSANISTYYMEKDDQVLKASNNATVGDADTEHQGVELELAYQWSPQWRMTMAAAWARHEIDRASAFESGVNVSGNDMDTAPEWMGSAQLQYTPRHDWMIELEGVYMDEHYVDVENENDYEGHTIWNATVTWQVSDALSARARVQNLTDERYAERADFSFGSYRYFTGENRGVFVELKHAL